MLLNEPPQDKNTKQVVRKSMTLLKLTIYFVIFLYFYHLFLNFRFAQLTPQIWENYHKIYPFVPIEIILDKNA